MPRGVPNAAKLAWVRVCAPLPVRLLKVYVGIDRTRPTEYIQCGYSALLRHPSETEETSVVSVKCRKSAKPNMKHKKPARVRAKPRPLRSGKPL